jgi:hypothetical protein
MAIVAIRFGAWLAVPSETRTKTEMALVGQFE